MACLVKQHDNDTWDAKRIRRRPAVCSWRRWLRRIDCHDQRPVLVRPAKEKILTKSEQVRPEIKSAARRAVLPKNRRLVSAERSSEQVRSPNLSRLLLSGG